MYPSFDTGFVTGVLERKDKKEWEPIWNSDISISFSNKCKG